MVIIMNFMKSLATCGLASLIAVSSTVAVAEGDLTRRPTKLPDLVLGTEDNRYLLSQTEYNLETGKSYKLKIISSGQTEYALKAPDFSARFSCAKSKLGIWRLKQPA